MKEHDITSESAFHNYDIGYEEGYKQGKKDATIHAKWEVNGCGEVECVKCGFCIGNADSINDYIPRFCPDCGAKMDEKAEKYEV